ncbi:MAG: hypothetical protein QXJ11_06255 [Candidatus Bathyarchaeia archaeon]
MRKILQKVSVIPLVALILLGMLPMLSIVNAATTEIYVSPANIIYDTSTATLGTRFNITVWVKGVEDMKTWQVEMHFNHSVINVTRWFEPTWNSSYVFYGKTTLPVPAPPKVSYGSVSPTEGWLGVGSALFPAPSPGGGFTGNGLLCIIEFEIKSLPGKFQEFTSILDLNYPGGTFWIKAGESAKRAFDVYTPGFYKITWVLPPKPRLAVDPTYREYGPWDYVVGWKFNELVFIDDLDPAWGLTTATFALEFDPTLLAISSWSVDTLWATSTVTPDTGRINVSVADPTATPSGDVPIIVIEFEIIYQGESPPLPPMSYNESPLNLVDIVLYNHVEQIPTNPPLNGKVRIYALMALPLSWLEVVDAVDGDHLVELGPEPSIGKEFEVHVIIRNLHPEWKMVAYQFRLCFDDSLIEGVSITEGPFLKDPRWNKYGTLFISRFDPPIYPYRACAVVGDILWNYTYLTTFPQAPGPDVPNLVPPVNPILATIRFRAKAQASIDLNDVLDLWDGGIPPVDRFLMDVDRNWIPLTDNINCTYKMKGFGQPGRVIDVFGGVIDTQITGLDPYPDGFNGKGPNQPMDMVWPQKEVVLYAKVTYNYWPVQNKPVSFEVTGPNGFEWKGTAITNESGIARITFRMPWQCFDAEKYFGVYTVTATADVYCVVVNDTMQFHYDWLVRIFKVTTNKLEYNHCETVEITVTYGSHLMMPIDRQKFPAEFWVYISDEVNQPIGKDLERLYIGGATFCQYKNGTLTFRIHVPKYAVAGWADIHVNCFSENPTLGGWAWCPEVLVDNAIYIRPY